jgi:hypothetical protein
VRKPIDHDSSRVTVQQFNADSIRTLAKMQEFKARMRTWLEPTGAWIWSRKMAGVRREALSAALGFTSFSTVAVSPSYPRSWSLSLFGSCEGNLGRSSGESRSMRGTFGRG